MKERNNQKARDENEEKSREAASVRLLISLQGKKATRQTGTLRV